MGLMMLAASPGYSIRVTASGPEAVQVIDALEQLIAPVSARKADLRAGAKKLFETCTNKDFFISHCRLGADLLVRPAIRALRRAFRRGRMHIRKTIRIGALP